MVPWGPLGQTPYSLPAGLLRVAPGCSLQQRATPQDGMNWSLHLCPQLGEIVARSLRLRDGFDRVLFLQGFTPMFRPAGHLTPVATDG